MSEIEEMTLRFDDIARSKIFNDHLEDVLNFLHKRDFYTAPASTRFHGSCEGGLLAHSLNVYDNILKVDDAFNLNLDPSSMATAALFHDICKVNVYKPGTRNVKNAQGRWETVPTWEFDDNTPLGHGEKSVIMLQALGFSLTISEMYAIRWHMGGFDNAVRGGERAISKAYEICPLAVALQMADMAATYFNESKQ